jgi:hypothetical protein
MTTPAIAIPRGGRQAEERAAAEKANRKSGFNNDWEYFSLEAPEGEAVYGETKVIRFVTDEQDFRETRQHAFVNTKPAPKDKPSEKKWPTKMGSVCRQSPVFVAVYNDCYICEADEYLVEGNKGMYHKKPGLRLWAVAVEREPLTGTEEMAKEGLIEAYEVGSVVGYQDVLVDREVDGKTEKAPKFVVLNYGLENFFNSVLGSHNAYGTLLDRDYKVTRKGKGTDTDYIIAPLDKQKHTDGKPFDLRRPDLAEQYKIPFNLDEIIANLASDEYYEWFFDRRVESSWEKRFPKKEGEETSESGGESAAQEAATKDTINKMRDRFRSNA